MIKKIKVKKLKKLKNTKRFKEWKKIPPDTLHIYINNHITPEYAEKLEDLLEDLLEDNGYSGYIQDNVTGNTVRFGKQTQLA